MESRRDNLELAVLVPRVSSQKMRRRQRHPLLRSRLLGTLLRQSGRLLHELMLKSPLKLLAPLNHPDIAEKRSKRPEPYRKRSRSPMHGPLLPSASLLPLPGPLQDEKQAPILRSTSELKKKTNGRKLQVHTASEDMAATQSLSCTYIYIIFC